MGAPKQKWTSEEEAALKAGVLKHGPGKWCSILKDQEFRSVLFLRSNVDLKDKWRNMSVIANGSGSREKTRLTVRVHHGPKYEDNPYNIGSVTQSDEEFDDTTSLATSSESPQIGISKRSIVGLDNLIMEALNKLKEPGGSNKATIAACIEDEYWTPPNFKRLLSAKMKYMTATGKLIKMKHKYRLAPISTLSGRGRHPCLPLVEGKFEGRQRISPILHHEDIGAITRSQIDLELANMRNMTPQEAAAIAAQAVAEANAAIAEAEEAAKEAEAAEADADVAEAFVEAAARTFKGRNIPRVMVRA